MTCKVCNGTGFDSKALYGPCTACYEQDYCPLCGHYHQPDFQYTSEGCVAVYWCETGNPCDKCGWKP